jgi:hypothetical protein
MRPVVSRRLMMMLIGWDHVSELRPQWVCCSSPRWCMSMENHGGTLTEEKILIRPPTTALWQSYQQSHVVASRRNGRRGWWICSCQVFLFVPASDFLHVVKSYDMVPQALLPLRKKSCCGFLSLLKYHRFGRVWTRANHYATEVTYMISFRITHSVLHLLCIFTQCFQLIQSR